MRSTIPRVSSRSASGSGFSMMIQPASGPGVCDRAMCRICSKFWVTSRPTLAPFSSSTMLVETVVPCSSAWISPAGMPDWATIFCTPVRMPTDWSSGVDGVLRSCISRDASLNSRRSVKVPPTSMPRRLAMPPPRRRHRRRARNAPRAPPAHGPTDWNGRFCSAPQAAWKQLFVRFRVTQTAGHASRGLCQVCASPWTTCIPRSTQRHDRRGALHHADRQGCIW